MSISIVAALPAMSAVKTPRVAVTYLMIESDGRFVCILIPFHAF